MAESTTPRFGVHQWSDSTDTPSRVEFNDSFNKIEQLGAIDKQGDTAGRPAPGVIGTYYYDTATGALWRDTGTSWVSVGSRTYDAVATASAAGKVAFTAQGASGQIANLFEARHGDTSLKASISSGGALFAQGSITGARLRAVATDAASPVISGKGIAGQIADLLSLTASDDSNRFKVTRDGNIQSPFFGASAGAGVIGTGSASNVQGAATMSGTPAFEVRSTKGGAGTFNDFIYFKHGAADATAVSRRLGFYMKVGDEIAGDATKSGGMYLESSAASFADPQLVLSVADAPAMTLKKSDKGASTVHNSLDVEGTVQATGSRAFVSGGTSVGRQADHQYFRAGGTSGFYWYKGGNHSDTPGDAGGGTKLAALDTNGKLEVGKLWLTSTTDAAPGTSEPPLMIGPPGGENLIFDNNEIMARSNGAASTLSINYDGGDVILGGAGSKVDVRGTFLINGTPVHISANAPASPVVGTIWIDI